ncbi:MAG: HAD-IIIA family hydrolase [Solirubrobacterales bacterium]|nr:HAD-IIIA family hydrolase [Solirubrobacterales bacterium]
MAPRERAVFVDRDGVINELVVDRTSGLCESPLAVEDVRLIAGAADALRRLSQAGWRLIGVSNQPAAAKGTVAACAIDAVQERVMALCSQAGVRFDDFRLCLHHPHGVVAELTGECDCRKPAPGMLLSAAEALSVNLPASWMVGDTDADVMAGRVAGCRTILVAQPGSVHKRSGTPVPDAAACDLPAAARLILSAPKE